MRRTIITMTAVACLGLVTGCIIFPSTARVGVKEHEVVSVNGRVYVIHKQSGKVREVDLSSAESFESPPCVEETGGNDGENSCAHVDLLC